MFFPALVFCFGALVEGVFGFAGTIVSFAILGFFVDIKELVFLAWYAFAFVSIYVMLTDLKSVDWRLCRKMILWAIPGLVLGAHLLHIVNSEVLFLIFAWFLLAFSVQSFLSVKALPPVLQKVCFFGSGVINGILGTGGPLIVLALKNQVPKRVFSSYYWGLF